MPLHITGVWKPLYSDNPLESGSVGVGLVLEPSTQITYPIDLSCDLEVNDRCISIDMISLARDLYGYRDKMRIRSRVPLGVGAGVSANIAVGIGYSVSRNILSVDETIHGARRLISAGLIAHELEVRSRTGLGDVIAELAGYGLEFRRKPGPPCIGEIESFLTRDVSVIVGVLTTTLYTPEMLRRMSPEIIARAESLIERFDSDPSIETFTEISHEFSKTMGFLSRDLDEVIRDSLKRYIAGGVVFGYYVKKSLLVILYDRKIDIDPSVLRDLNLASIVRLNPTSKSLIDSERECVRLEEILDKIDVLKRSI
ncbi:MAG: hypothetical protein ABWJ42_02070 [Sulfolobales archaeon]